MTPNQETNDRIEELTQEYRWARMNDKQSRAIRTLKALKQRDGLPVKDPQTESLVTDIEARSTHYGTEAAKMTRVVDDHCEECQGTAEVTKWAAPGNAESGTNYRCCECGHSESRNTL
jgi:hypothetical protein